MQMQPVNGLWRAAGAGFVSFNGWWACRRSGERVFCVDERTPTGPSVQWVAPFGGAEVRREAAHEARCERCYPIVRCAIIR
jgi:hypothetical protein